MTVIAYRDGVLAADTLCSQDDVACGFRHKIERVGRLVIGAAGAVTSWEAFRDWVRGGMDGDHPVDEANCFVIMKDGVTVTWCGSGPFREVEPYWALGSGRMVAMGAMEAGAGAEGAVEAAINRVLTCGGPIDVIRL